MYSTTPRRLSHAPNPFKHIPHGMANASVFEWLFFLTWKGHTPKKLEKSKSWHWLFERIQDQYPWCWIIYRSNSSNMNWAIADTIVNGTRPRYIVALSPLAQNMLHIAYCLMHFADCQLSIAYCHIDGCLMLPTSYCLVPYIAKCVIYCILPDAFCILSIAYCLMQTHYGSGPADTTKKKIRNR